MVSRTPRGRDDFAELVRRVRDDLGARKQHWVEWKGEVDLKEKGSQAKIAKFVLGTSNRPKRIWELATEGRAYMLLGVEPGQLRDTPLPDSAVFEKGVNRYLGAERPRWLAIPLEVDGTVVAVITVGAAGARAQAVRGQGQLHVHHRGRPDLHPAGLRDHSGLGVRSTRCSGNGTLTSEAPGRRGPCA